LRSAVHVARIHVSTVIARWKSSSVADGNTRHSRRERGTTPLSSRSSAQSALPLVCCARSSLTKSRSSFRSALIVDPNENPSRSFARNFRRSALAVIDKTQPLQVDALKRGPHHGASFPLRACAHSSAFRRGQQFESGLRQRHATHESVGDCHRDLRGRTGRHRRNRSRSIFIVYRAERQAS